ncbi:MAG: AraC family transcriptional regulator [Saccharofermentanales bacterium]
MNMIRTLNEFINDKYNDDVTSDSIFIRLMPSMNARLNLLYIQGVGHTKAMPAYFVERQDFLSYEAFINLSGRARLVYENNEYFLDKGKCALIDCRIHHIYYPVGDTPWEYLMVHFNGLNSGLYFNIFKDNNIIPVIEPPNFNDFVEIIEKLIETNKVQNSFTELNNSRYINNLLTEFILNTKNNKEDNDTFILMPEHIKNIISHIDANYKDEIYLEKFSNEYSISKSHLCREFKNYTGHTIIGFLNEKRISKATELLKTTIYPISTIGKMIGLDDTTHFIKLFKQKEGLTPLAFRKNAY